MPIYRYIFITTSAVEVYCILWIVKYTGFILVGELRGSVDIIMVRDFQCPKYLNFVCDPDPRPTVTGFKQQTLADKLFHLY